ncbi:ROK family protein [Evansella sp. AB-P1]|uniref:ROK family protein n=1 Tax=Evansella sp. AB-P1 TaxID=3037653 RepID=UPI00241C2D8E|nr:ROK family protein [Evansella sp. AB-P1]MDG5788779.1 ROK family protein [Evansella sp. AB-P1]
MVDKYSIRELNESNVLAIIIQHKIISRADISKVSELNKATISSIVSTLTEKKLIKEVGIGISQGGRRPVMYCFNEKAGLSLSIDIGSDYLSSILTYLDGTIVIHKEVLHEKINQKDIFEKLCLLIDEYFEISPKTPYGIVGITLGIHGIVYENNIIFTPNYHLAGMNISDYLQNRYKVPITLENEANLSVLGEWYFSTYLSNLVSISISSGIGAGIIIDNSLYKGVKGYSGEIGHTIVVPNGRKCPCGNLGCIERYASEHVLLMEYGSNKGEDVSFEDFKKNYLAGETTSKEIIDSFVYYISLGLNNVIKLFSPEVIIINSKFTNELDGIIEKIKDNLSTPVNRNTTIKASELREQATLLGGAYININNFLPSHNITTIQKDK